MTGVSVILPSLPKLAEETKRKENRYSGYRTACSSYVQALLECDSVERLVVHCSLRTPKASNPLTHAYRSIERLEFLSTDQIRESFADTSRAILQSYTPSLERALHLRATLGSPSWPIVAMTHDLSEASVYRGLLLTLLGQPKHYDAIVCSTKCAQGVMARLLDRAKHVVRCTTAPRLPVVPFAIPEGATRTVERADALRHVELSGDALKFLYFGRLCHKTKADLLPLLRAFHEVHRQEPNTHLLIGGGVWEGRDESLRRYERYADDLGLRQAVSFFANASAETRRALFASADVLVAPADSLQESFGLVLLEAMATGLPIIASDFNGYRDVIGDSGAGLLVRTLAPALPRVSAELAFEDPVATHETFSQATAVDIDRLAEVMLDLARSPECRREMAARGTRHLFEKFRWPTVMRQHYAIWDELCSTAAFDNTPAVPSPYVYDHDVVFRHHVSEVLKQNTVFALSQWAVHSSLPLIKPPRHLKRTILESVLARLHDGPVDAAALSMPPEVALQYLAYLLKHGMARVLD